MREPADESSMREMAVRALMLERRIMRRRIRMAKWDEEAAAVEAGWIGGPAYRKFCEQLAAAAREKNAELETELKQLQGP